MAGELGEPKEKIEPTEKDIFRIGQEINCNLGTTTVVLINWLSHPERSRDKKDKASEMVSVMIEKLEYNINFLKKNTNIAGVEEMLEEERYILNVAKKIVLDDPSEAIKLLEEMRALFIKTGPGEIFKRYTSNCIRGVYRKNFVDEYATKKTPEEKDAFEREIMKKLGGNPNWGFEYKITKVAEERLKAKQEQTNQ